MRLADNNRIVIVGGGPAGSFTALHLLRFATAAGLQIKIDIFEGRNFEQPGPEGCNKCAGILSSHLTANLHRLDLELPEALILARLDTYVLHLGTRELATHTPNPKHPILSVCRGSGPRLGLKEVPPSFDLWLLEQAQARGASLHRQRVLQIRAAERPIIMLEDREFEADLVVIATGVNSQVPLDPAWGYHPPRTEVMAQDEIPMPANVANNEVHIFFEPPQGLLFGGVVPKRWYANLSLLGRDLPQKAINTFLEAHGASLGISHPTPWLCGCRPRVAVSPAKGYYADRMVAVGDCTASRLYKDGLGSAFLTAESAAHTAIQMGISRQDFAAGYAPTCRQISQDNRFGRLLFWLLPLYRRSSFLVDTWLHTITQEEALPLEQQIHRYALWGLFTGDESYQQIFKLLSSRQAILRMVQGALSRRSK